MFACSHLGKMLKRKYRILLRNKIDQTETRTSVLETSQTLIAWQSVEMKNCEKFGLVRAKSRLQSKLKMKDNTNRGLFDSNFPAALVRATTSHSYENSGTGASASHRSCMNV